MKNTRTILALLSTLLVLGTSACQSTKQRQLDEIEAAYAAGDLTKAEYIQMKHGAENAAKQRAATFLIR